MKNNVITNDQIEKVKAPKGKTKLLISDVIFKTVFNREPDILLKMIKDILDIREEVEISKDPFVFPGLESTPGTKSGKIYRGDMTVRLSDKSYILIEMNYRNDKSAIDRNLLHLTRVHSQILKSGTPDVELKNYRIRGLNLNNFQNDIDKPIENFAFCSLDKMKIASLIYTICNISLVKCKDLVYDINVINLPFSVRWGAILLEEDMDKISQILGDDMLTMEEKERFMDTIESVNDDDSVMQQWILEENARLKHEGQLEYARDEGIEQGRKEGIVEGRAEGRAEGSEIKEIELIKNMLEEGLDYSVISKVTGKTTFEIKEIEASIEK